MPSASNSPPAPASVRSEEAASVARRLAGEGPGQASAGLVEERLGTRLRPARVVGPSPLPTQRLGDSPARPYALGA